MARHSIPAHRFFSSENESEPRPVLGSLMTERRAVQVSGPLTRTSGTILTRNGNRIVPRSR